MYSFKYFTSASLGNVMAVGRRQKSVFSEKEDDISVNQLENLKKGWNEKWIGGGHWSGDINTHVMPFSWLWGFK